MRNPDPIVVGEFTDTYDLAILTLKTSKRMCSPVVLFIDDKRHAAIHIINMPGTDKLMAARPEHVVGSYTAGRVYKTAGRQTQRLVEEIQAHLDSLNLPR